MRAEINPRPTDRPGQNEIKPAPPAKKQNADRADDHVVRDVARWKGRPGFVAIRFIRIADGWFFEEGEESRIRPFQLDHPNFLHLFRPAAIDRRLQGADQSVIGEHERQGEADNEGASFESREDQQAKPNDDEERLPDFHVADRRHEQIERRIRPSFVDQMKEPLVHSRQF